MSSSNWRWIKYEDADDVDLMLTTELKQSTTGSSLKAAKPEYKRKLAQKHLNMTLRLRNTDIWCDKLEKNQRALESFLQADQSVQPMSS